MDTWQENKNRKQINWDKWIDILLKAEIVLFIIIFVIAIAYYNYDSAHPYFNRYISDMGIPWYSLEALTSTIASDIFGVSFFCTFFFPLVFLAQVIVLFLKKAMNKKRAIKLGIIIVLYFSCILSTLLFYSINNSNNFKERFKEQEEIKQK